MTDFPPGQAIQSKPRYSASQNEASRNGAHQEGRASRASLASRVTVEGKVQPMCEGFRPLSLNLKVLNFFCICTVEPVRSKYAYLRQHLAQGESVREKKSSNSGGVREKKSSHIRPIRSRHAQSSICRHLGEADGFQPAQPSEPGKGYVQEKRSKM